LEKKIIIYESTRRNIPEDEYPATPLSESQISKRTVF